MGGGGQNWMCLPPLNCLPNWLDAFAMPKGHLKKYVDDCKMACSMLLNNLGIQFQTRAPTNCLSPLPPTLSLIPSPTNGKKLPRMRDRNHFLNYLHHLLRSQSTLHPPENDPPSPK